MLPDDTSEGQYFPNPLLTENPSEVFVDCGAWDGDTLRAFLQRYTFGFEHYFAFEPDPGNRSRIADLLTRVSGEQSSRVTVVAAALGNQSGIVRFQTGRGPLGTVSSDGDLEVRALTLDDYFQQEWQASRPTFIKMDIEGAEPLALEGARHTMSRYRPVLAICIYHHPDHCWQIPLWIHSLELGYRFFLRSYVRGGLETVVYAIPESLRSSEV